MGSINVTWWNLENFFDTDDDPISQDFEFTAAQGWTEEAFTAKRANLAQALKATHAGAGPDLLVVADPALARVELLGLLHPPPALEPGIHPTAIVGPGCRIDSSAHLGPYAVVGEGSQVTEPIVDESGQKTLTREAVVQVWPRRPRAHDGHVTDRSRTARRGLERGPAQRAGRSARGAGARLARGAGNRAPASSG